MVGLTSLDGRPNALAVGQLSAGQFLEKGMHFLVCPLTELGKQFRQHLLKEQLRQGKQP